MKRKLFKPPSVTTNIIYPPLSIYYASMILFHRSKIYSYDRNVKVFADWYVRAIKKQMENDKFRVDQHNFLEQLHSFISNLNYDTYESIQFFDFYQVWYELVHISIPFFVCHSMYDDFMEYEEDLKDWYSMLEYELANDYWKFYLLGFNSFGVNSYRLLKPSNDTRTLWGYCILSSIFHNNKEREEMRGKNMTFQEKMEKISTQLGGLDISG